MLTLILAEAELETIPSELLYHPLIVSSARQKGKNPAQIILDSNYHHKAMTQLSEGTRRGRPDIVHVFLLTALESIVNKQGYLNIMIHTRYNQVITVNPETRIMRNYDRFIGLLEQLFEHHVVPKDGTPLLKLQSNQSLQQLVDEATADHVIACSRTGKTTNLHNYLTELKKQQPHHIVCIIGGFPSGTFHTDMTTITPHVLSLYKEMLSVWTVASEVLVNYEVAAL